jgi:hypothetical protein
MEQIGWGGNAGICRDLGKRYENGESNIQAYPFRVVLLAAKNEIIYRKNAANSLYIYRKKGIVHDKVHLRA